MGEIQDTIYPLKHIIHVPTEIIALIVVVLGQTSEIGT